MNMLYEFQFLQFTKEDLCITVIGIDVHKILLWVHIKDEKGNDIFKSEIRRNPKGLQSLYRLCQQYHVEKAVMESTSTYWYPVYQKLKTVCNECCVVNAYQLKVLGRHKTDEKDAELLATWGLLNILTTSYIPSIEIHQLRELIRTRISKQNRKSGIISRLKTMLEGVCPGITAVLRDLNLLNAQLFLQNWGKSKLSYVQWLETIKDGRIRKALITRRSIMEYWWNNPLDEVQQFLLDDQIKEFEFQRDQLTKLETMIGETLEKTDLEDGVKYVKSIRGIGFLTAVTIVAELGSVDRFINAREAAVSSGLTPRLKGSAGKIHSGRITKHGPKSIRRATYIACKSVIKFSPKHRQFFQSVKERRGGKKALVALSRKLVALAWTLWSTKSYYVEVKI